MRRSIPDELRDKLKPHIVDALKLYEQHTKNELASDEEGNDAPTINGHTYGEHIRKAFHNEGLTGADVFIGGDNSELHVDTERFAVVGQLNEKKDVPVVINAVLKHKLSQVKHKTDSSVLCETLSEAPGARQKFDAERRRPEPTRPRQ